MGDFGDHCLAVLIIFAAVVSGALMGAGVAAAITFATGCF